MRPWTTHLGQGSLVQNADVEAILIGLVIPVFEQSGNLDRPEEEWGDGDNSPESSDRFNESLQDGRS